MESKPFWQSKTLLVQIFAGLALIVGVFSPSAGEFVKTHFAELGGAWALINIVVRLITKGKVEIA